MPFIMGGRSFGLLFSVVQIQEEKKLLTGRILLRIATTDLFPKRRFVRGFRLCTEQ